KMKSEPPPPRIPSEPAPRARSEPPPQKRLSEPPPPKKVSSDPPGGPPLRHLSDPPRPMAQAILDTEEASVESDRESSLPIDPEDRVWVESSPQGVSSSQPPPHSPRHVTPPPVKHAASAPRIAAAPPARAPLVIVPSHATTPSPLAPHTITEST